MAAVSRQMFADILSLIARLRAPPAPASGARGVSVASDAGRGMPRYGQSSAAQHPGSLNRQPRPPFACGEGDLSLPKPVEDAILGSKSPGIW
jgi:hypothetical protein